MLWYMGSQRVGHDGETELNSMDMSLGKFWELVTDQGGLACFSAWDHKESDTTERLN